MQRYASPAAAAAADCIEAAAPGMAGSTTCIGHNPR